MFGINISNKKNCLLLKQLGYKEGNPKQEGRKKMKNFFELCMEIELGLQQQMENGEKIIYSKFQTKENNQIVEKWIKAYKTDTEYFNEQLKQLEEASEKHNFVYLFVFFEKHKDLYSENPTILLAESKVDDKVCLFEKRRFRLYVNGFLIDRITKEEMLEKLKNKEMVFYLKEERHYLFDIVNEKLDFILV